MSRQFTHLIADSFYRTISDRLAEGTIGRLEDAEHPLTQLFAELDASVHHCLPPVGLNLWNQLVHHTLHERPLLQVAATIDADLAEIKLTAADEDKSSGDALRVAVELQEWVYQTYLPKSDLEFYVEENIAWLNGHWFMFDDDDISLRVLAYLWQHLDETVPSKVIAKEALSWDASGKTIKRRLKSLEAPFVNFAKSNKKGWRFANEELQRYLAN